MLNMPHRNANATARPVRIRVVVTMSVCWRFTAARDSTSSTFQGNGTVASPHGSPIRWLPTSKNHDQPAPSKIALYVVTGFLPVV